MATTQKYVRLKYTTTCLVNTVVDVSCTNRTRTSMTDPVSTRAAGSIKWQISNEQDGVQQEYDGKAAARASQMSFDPVVLLNNTLQKDPTSGTKLSYFELIVGANQPMKEKVRPLTVSFRRIEYSHDRGLYTRRFHVPYKRFQQKG